MTWQNPNTRVVAAMMASVLQVVVLLSGRPAVGRGSSIGLNAAADRSSMREASVEVRDAGAKGMGAFASEALKAGAYVGSYEGLLTTLEATRQRYAHLTEAEQEFVPKEYVFELDAQYCIDARNSTHFTRYLNHAEYGNLEVQVDAEAQRVDFFAACDVAADEELLFDYGYEYWRVGQPPSPESDSRNYSSPFYQTRPPELSLLYPPPVGTVLPLTPLNTVELQAALMLPERESAAALMRCLDYFGAAREADGTLVLPVGVSDDAERLVIQPDDQPPSHATLQQAAVACLGEALGVDNSNGDAARELAAWMADADAEHGLIRRWRSRLPRLSTPRHDALAAAVYLLWKNPAGHEVEVPLSKEQCDALVGRVAAASLAAVEAAERSREPSGSGSDSALDSVVEELGRHAPSRHVTELTETLTRCFELGDGCVVAAHRPPRLEGAVPGHLRRVWGRVPELVESGHLTYEAAREE